MSLKKQTIKKQTKNMLFRIGYILCRIELKMKM